MKIRKVLSYIFASMLYIAFAGAIFFTDSKDNDYPRIGKRLLPSSVYKTWLAENEKIEYLPYGYQSQPYKAERTMMVPVSPDGFYTEPQDFDSSKRSYPLQREARLPNRELHERIMSYLNADDELNF